MQPTVWSDAVTGLPRWWPNRQTFDYTVLTKDTSHTRFADWWWPWNFIWLQSVVLTKNTRVMRDLPVDGNQWKTDKKLNILHWPSTRGVKPTTAGLNIKHSPKFCFKKIIGQHCWAVRSFRLKIKCHRWDSLVLITHLSNIQLSLILSLKSYVYSVEWNFFLVHLLSCLS